MRKSIVFSLILSGALAACGLKGPLYLPPPQKPAANSPATTPDAQSDGRKNTEPAKK